MVSKLTNQGKERPLHQLHARSSSHLASDDRVHSCTTILYKVGVHSYTISKQLIIKVEISRSCKIIIARNAVHRRIHPVHQQKQTSAVHQVLIKHKLLSVVKCFGGTGDD